MRLNRKWLYLGGLIAMLTLLLTLTWVLPAGAVGTLDGGSVSVDKDYVSPNPDTTNIADNLKARTVKVTLENSGLTENEAVQTGSDLGPIRIEVGTEIPSTDSTFRVEIGAAAVQNGLTITAEDGPDEGDTARDALTVAAVAARFLPIVGDVSVDDETSDDLKDALGTPRVINAKTGLIEFPVLATIPVSTTDFIYLSYNTSKSETALVNVRGDENFDLLLVEGTDQGKYSETFVVNDPSKVLMNPGVAPGTPLDAVSYAVVHEQHSIPSSLRGYVEVDNERISTFYYSPTAGAAHDNLRGTLSGANAYQTALGTLSDPADENSGIGIASGQTFYARVANPPIRDGADAGTEVTIADVRHDAPSDITVALVDPEQGILSFTTTAVFDGFSGGDIEVDYIGSDSFYVTVDHGPINLSGVTDLTDIDLSDSANAAPVIAAGNITIALPTPDDDTAAVDVDTGEAPATADFATSVFSLVSIENDGNNCVDCRLRVGVVTGPKDQDDPETLNARYSVLAISYAGMERLDVPDGYDVTDGPDDNGTGIEFTRVLNFAPADTNAATDAMDHDIDVVAVTAVAAVGGWTADDIDVATNTDGTPKINGRRVTFTLDASDFLNTASPPQETDSLTFDITYTREVGALPRNALNPDATDRPVLAMATGTRARISSSNNSTSVDAETQGPSFSNPMPAHKSGTGSNSELLSIDVTDSLAGVNKKTITFKVRAGSAVEQTVKTSDLTITDIEGGYRASIALNKVRSGGSGPTLSVSTSRETPINWYAIADDNAGNSGTSDSNSEMRDKPGEDASETQNASNPAGHADCQRRTIGSDDCYTFTVDGVSPSMQRAYTGDWFNAAETRVEGDRRISRDNYLPGKGSKTSVRVVFNEAIDSNSVSADDFTVDGAVPSDAVVHNSGKTGGADGADTVNGEIRRSVFLTVAEMSTDATPVVVLTGTVSDLAGNSVSSGTRTASDGLAPGGTLTVDKAVDKKTVTVTVVTDEPVRLQSPDLKLWTSDALDDAAMLDEMDTFEVAKETSADNSPLVIKDSAGNVVYSEDLRKSGTLKVTLSKAPLLDRNTRSRTGVVNGSDILVSVTRADTQDANSVGTGTDSVHVVTVATGAVTDAKKGDIEIGITGAVAERAADDTATPAVTARAALPELKEGDKIVVTYRGTDPDPANQIPGVPSNVRGVPVTGATNTWTYKMDFNRDGRYAATAEMEDGNLNRGSGGIADPKKSGATVFEIDSELAADTDTDAVSDPGDGDSVGKNDPIFVELSWDAEEDEYVSDSHNNVTLTKAELNGEDVLANAVAQDANTYRIRLDGLDLGDYTLVYNAMDDAGNTNARDRDLKFTVTEQPTWTLSLKAGMNLVSLPSNPSGGTVDDIFGPVHQVDLVFTFVDGRARVAVRNPGTGTFTPGLDTIDAQHAYWVRASNAVDVEINISAAEQTAVLPSIAVMGGEWNLVPVLSLGSITSKVAGSGAAPGTLIDADAYLGDFQVAFGWENGRWHRIDPDPASDADRLENDVDTPAESGDDPLKVGMGYWVLYTDDAYIVPR